MAEPRQHPHPARIPALRVRTADRRSFRFVRPFHVGRGDECDVQVDAVGVSRKHALISIENGRWWVRDLESLNGTLVNGQRVPTVPVDGVLTIQLGTDGPVLALELEPAVSPKGGPLPPRIREPASDEELLAQYQERYFGSTPGDEPVGDRTIMIRRAFQKVQKKQKRKHVWIAAALALVALSASGYALYGHRQIRQQRVLAQELFYAMKALDVDIANIERLVAASGAAEGREQVRTYRDRRRRMEGDYEKFLSGLRRSERRLPPQEQVILRVTRMFGECDLTAPPGYVAEVQNYVQKWVSSGRYVRAVNLARDRGYPQPIARELLNQNLPPQFFYLAMQESGFDPFASGPPTYKGIAKGMWQFVPETALKYGLTIGPLVQFRRPDPADERHDWQKATTAAARYIKDIYATDAQASGLLVTASYNWGEHRVVDLLRSMPASPRERNFWQVLQKHRQRLPQETYDYVFYVVSAAVIGENPRLFGIDLDNPLAFLEQR